MKQSLRQLALLGTLLSASPVLANSSGFVRNTSPARAAANFASHTPSVPGVRVAPARMHTDGSTITVARTARGPFGQTATATVTLTPRSGGTAFRETTTGTPAARIIHGAVYSSDKVGRVLSGR